MVKKEKFFYKDLADRIQGQIEGGGYKVSEKLPSLRALCRTTGFSMTTVFQAYVELEKRGVVESRHRSGYFIRPGLGRLRPMPKIIRHEMVPGRINLDEIINELTADMGNPDILKLGAVAVAPEHLPVRRLHRQITSLPKARVPGVIAGYAHPQGDELLRHQITNFLFPVIPHLTMEDIVVTNGCTESLSLSLKAVAEPGDTIVMESPADPWLRQMLKDNRLFAMEVPADPKTGINPDRIARIIRREKVAACVLNANCQNPLGFNMPDDRKQAVLNLLGEKDIPIIENDTCGEIYFGEFRPTPVKKWDTRGNVIYCSSFSKVLAPGLRVGWVIPGRFKNKVRRMKLNRSLLSPALNQTIVASYLKEGGFNRHLRRLRQIIKLQYQYCAAAVHKYFPRSVKMTSPSGGLSLWIEMPPNVLGRDVYIAARKRGISILPGFLCASYKGFDRYIRIGYGGRWDDAMENAVMEIGDIIRSRAGIPPGK